MIMKEEIKKDNEVKPLKKWLVTNQDTGRSIEVEAVNKSKAVDIAHKTLRFGSENTYTWRLI
jgi:hypothetical protein